jgi:hypothetical protein
VASYCWGSASAVYITRDGAGSKTGTSLANAGACDSTPGTAQSTCAFFNNSSNWGAGSTQIGPGTVIHLGGDGVAITATAGANGYMTFQASGTSGNVIELLFDNGFASAGLNAPYWCCSLGGGAINLSNQSYILIDGGASQPCGWNTATNVSEGTCNGTIQATANGDALANQQETTGISSGSCNNVEIRNLGIVNLYVKSNSALSPVSNSISLFCDGNAANFSVHDSLFHDNYQHVTWAPGTGTNGPVSWYNNNVYNMNQGFIEYAAAAATISTFNIYGNRIHDMALWDTSGGGYHHDGIYLTYPNGPPQQIIASLQVYKNVFDGAAQGTGNPGATSWFYMDGNDTITAGYFYNNVVLQTTAPSSGSPGDPLINWGINGGTVYFYNNTFVCSTSNGNPGGFEIDQHSGMTTANVFDNLVVNCGRFVNLSGSWSPPQGCCVSTLAAWQSGSTGIGQDSHAAFTSGTAGLGGSYENGSSSPLAGIIPQSGSVAYSAGTNLTSLAITALNTDITGAARPSTGAWAAGALQPSNPSSISFSGKATVTCPSGCTFTQH